ncbi:MAG: hypothetical protein WC728_03400 [Elusimicrobiota bacterium]
MRTRFAAVALAVALAAALFAAANAEGGKKGHSCPMKGKGQHSCKCPMKMEGVEAQVANTAAGVTITLTAKDPETVKKLQAAVAEHMKKAGEEKSEEKAHH